MIYNFTTDADLYVNLEKNKDSHQDQVCNFVIEHNNEVSYDFIITDCQLCLFKKKT